MYAISMALNWKKTDSLALPVHWHLTNSLRRCHSSLAILKMSMSSFLSFFVEQFLLNRIARRWPRRHYIPRCYFWKAFSVMWDHRNSYTVGILKIFWNVATWPHVLSWCALGPEQHNCILTQYLFRKLLDTKKVEVFSGVQAASVQNWLEHPEHKPRSGSEAVCNVLLLFRRRSGVQSAPRKHIRLMTTKGWSIANRALCAGEKSHVWIYTPMSTDTHRHTYTVFTHIHTHT